MTIAIISMIRDSWGGSEELWADMAKEALANGHRVMHVSYDCGKVHPKMQALIQKGLISYKRPSYIEKSDKKLMQLFDKGINFLKKRMNKSLEKIFSHNPDIVLYNGTCYSIAEEKKLLQLLKKNSTNFFILGHFNDEVGWNLTNTSRKEIRQDYDISKKVFFISNRNLENAKRQLACAIHHALVVRNPVNISSTEAIRYPASPVIQMAMVGNLRIIHKGQDITFEVLSSKEWQSRSWHLNVYGSGEDEAYLKELASFYKLNNRISFHGKVNDIRKVWEHNHILLMPSHMEGMPLAIVEAMICGRPCVATDVGGIKEWVEEDRSGFIAAAATVSSFGKALEKAWTHKDDWQKTGIYAHNRAMSLYDPHPGKTLLELMTKDME